MKDGVRTIVLLAAAALWTVSLTVLIASTFVDGDSKLGRWAIMLGLWACVATGWLLLDLERRRVETIARLLEQREKPEGMRRV